MRKIRKSCRIIILTVVLIVIFCCLVCCSFQSSMAKQNVVSVRALGTATDIHDIQINMEYGDVEVYSLSMGLKTLSDQMSMKDISDDEILVEVSDRENVPEVTMSVTQEGTLQLVETEKRGENTVENYKVYIYIPDDMQIGTCSVKNELGDFSLSGKLIMDSLSVELKNGDFYLDATDSTGKDKGTFGDFYVYAEDGSIYVISIDVEESIDLLAEDLISVEDANCSGDVSMQSEIGDIIFDGTVMGDLLASTKKGSIDISGEMDGSITLTGEESSNITLKLNGAPEKYNYSVSVPNGSILYNDEGTISKTLEKDNGADNTISIKGNGADVSITFY